LSPGARDIQRRGILTEPMIRSETGLTSYARLGLSGDRRQASSHYSSLILQLTQREGNFHQVRLPLQPMYRYLIPFKHLLWLKFVRWFRIRSSFVSEPRRPIFLLFQRGIQGIEELEALDRVMPQLCRRESFSNYFYTWWYDLTAWLRPETESTYGHFGSSVEQQIGKDPNRSYLSRLLDRPVRITIPFTKRCKVLRMPFRQDPLLCALRHNRLTKKILRQRALEGRWIPIPWTRETARYVSKSQALLRYPEMRHDMQRILGHRSDRRPIVDMQDDLCQILRTIRVLKDSRSRYSPDDTMPKQPRYFEMEERCDRIFALCGKHEQLLKLREDIRMLDQELAGAGLRAYQAGEEIPQQVISEERLDRIIRRIHPNAPVDERGAIRVGSTLSPTIRAFLGQDRT
jgi:hypothetical protein